MTEQMNIIKLKVEGQVSHSERTIITKVTEGEEACAR
jgi:hypothetical protein